MVKMIELSGIVIGEMVKDAENAAVLLYHISKRCDKAKSNCRSNPLETHELLEELSCTLAVLSDSLQKQAAYLDEYLLEDPKSQAA